MGRSILFRSRLEDVGEKRKKTNLVPSKRHKTLLVATYVNHKNSVLQAEMQYAIKPGQQTASVDNYKAVSVKFSLILLQRY